MTDRHALLRRAWRDHFATVDRISRQNVEAENASRERMFAGDGYQPFVPQPYPTFPPELRGLTCGARTRAGTPCRRTDLERSGRCKFHGGRSSGPTSPDGIARARQNLALRWKASEAREDRVDVRAERVIARARAKATFPDGRMTEVDQADRDPEFLEAVHARLARPEGLSGQIAHAREAAPVSGHVAPAPARGSWGSDPAIVLNVQPATLSADALAAIEALAARRRDRCRR